MPQHNTEPTIPTGEQKTILAKIADVVHSRAGRAGLGLVMIPVIAAATTSCNGGKPVTYPTMPAPSEIASGSQTPVESTRQNDQKLPDVVIYPDKTKEVNGITYVWTVDTEYGIGYYGDQRQMTGYKSDHNMSPDLPRVSAYLDDKSFGDTANENVTNSTLPGCSGQTSIPIQGATEAARLTCPDFDDPALGSGFIDFFIQKPSGDLIDIEITRSDSGTATFADQLAAADALDPAVIG